MTTATERSAYYSAEKNVVIDLINPDTGRTYYGGKTADEVRAEYPDAELLTLNEAGKRHEAPFREPVSEITEEKFWYWLEVLFPEDWQHGGGESFKVCERICGDVTRICAAFNDGGKHKRRYFTLCDDYNTPHKEILRRVREFARENHK